MFKRLGLHGLEPIAPVLVAALATEEPLLLIGPHGTAKSLLLTRWLPPWASSSGTTKRAWVPEWACSRNPLDPKPATTALLSSGR